MSWLSDYVDSRTIVIFIGALISAVGAFWFSSERVRSQREPRQMSERMAVKNEEIAAQSKEIAALNREIKDSVTGGDSFCYVVFANLTANTGPLGVITEGQYPLYDVAIPIHDLEKAARLSGMPGWEMLAQTDTHPKVGNLGPRQTAIWQSWQLPAADQ